MKKKKPCVYSDVAYLQHSGHRHYSSGCSREELKLDFSYLEVSNHILGWDCYILQSSDVCISRIGWTEMKAALNASVCVASVCRLFMPFLPPLLPHTHIYTHPVARSWPLGYHEFHSNGSRCDHVSFISLIRREHDKPDQIV